MRNKAFDAIIIGTGQAGPPLAAKLAAAGQKVAIIERQDIGGTCLNTGCIPSKILIESAKRIYQARHSEEMGLEITGAVKIDMKRLKRRKDRIVEDLSGGLEVWLEGLRHCTLIRGHAKFVASHVIEVAGREISADQIFLNVGARAFVPAIPGVNLGEYLTSSTMLALDHVPDDLVIIGGSYVGLEFAQMFRRFGSAVTVVEKGDRLLSREDPAVSNVLNGILDFEGIRFKLSAECLAIEKRAGRYLVDLDCQKGPKQIMATHVLLAVGRQPNTDDLGLENTAIEKDARGYLLVDDACRTNVPGIWALGECNGRGAFTHTAYNDHEIVASRLLQKSSRGISDRIETYALFTDPPLARVGLNVTQAKGLNRDLLMATLPMTRVKRARIQNETQGFMQVIVDPKTQEILGATIVGVNGDEVIHALTDLMYAKAPYTVLREAMHIHPTVSELLPTLLSHLKPLI